MVLFYLLRSEKDKDIKDILSDRHAQILGFSSDRRERVYSV